jgi:sugar/nucleoside kinase (ribokinase family)
MARLRSDAMTRGEPWRTDAVAITRGERGAVLRRRNMSPLVLPARPIAPAVARGAGDQFAATAAASLARGNSVGVATEQAVAAATAWVGSDRAGPHVGPGPEQKAAEIVARVRASGPP